MTTGHISSCRKYELRANLKPLHVAGAIHQKKPSSLSSRGKHASFSNDGGTKFLMWLTKPCRKKKDADFSLRWFLLLCCTGSRAQGLRSCGSQALEHRFSSCGACYEACGIFLEQELNLCLLHWQADSYPLNHHGSPLRPL